VPLPLTATCPQRKAKASGQARFIRAVDRAIVPLQDPSGTGKTSGATAPALLARAYARAHNSRSLLGLVVAPSHEAVDAVLAGVVDVTYCAYHTASGQTTLQTLASAVAAPGRDTDSTQCLLFVTPETPYRVLGQVAEALPAIDGTSAPAAMRHDAGLADVVCIDEASMLDVPGLLLAGSAVKPAGQTLLVGDHRQLATVTDVEWAETLRKPIQATQAHRSALDYVRWLNATVPAQTGVPVPASSDPDGQTGRTEPRTRQTQLSGFDAPESPQPPQGGDSR
jgi:hypothetical protein